MLSISKPNTDDFSLLTQISWLGRTTDTRASSPSFLILKTAVVLCRSGWVIVTSSNFRNSSPSMPSLPTGPLCLVLYTQSPLRSPSNWTDPERMLSLKLRSIETITYSEIAVISEPSRGIRNSAICSPFLNSRKDISVSTGVATASGPITNTPSCVGIVACDCSGSAGSPASPVGP